ncbi:hypothetical protein RCH11_000047 [Glaciihabitans sp. GrIS 2.15]|nr:hypothetical protein [Glaciihabitans sp. GrIS 2.15]
MEEWSSEGSGRHRSLCGGRTVATGRTTVWRLRRPNRLEAEQTGRLAGFEPDVQFETAELQSHICLGESGNAVVLLPGLVWIGRSATARHDRSRGRRPATLCGTDLGYLPLIELSFPSSRFVRWFYALYR